MPRSPLGAFVAAWLDGDGNRARAVAAAADPQLQAVMVAVLKTSGSGGADLSPEALPFLRLLYQTALDRGELNTGHQLLRGLLDAVARRDWGCAPPLQWLTRLRITAMLGGAMRDGDLCTVTLQALNPLKTAAWPHVWYYANRIGELAKTFDLGHRLRELGWAPLPRRFVVPEKSTAPALEAYWARKLELVPEGGISDSEPRPNLGWVPAGPWGWVYDQDALVLVHQEWERSGRPPPLTLHPEHRQRGRAWLAKHGMPEDAWFVTVHARTSHFLGDTPGGYHDFRNSDIHDYLLAIEEIRRRGGWVVRIGNDRMPPLPSLDGVIDYAKMPSRPSWLDTFFLADARFFLGDTSGPHVIPSAFGVPRCAVNYAPMSFRPWSSRDIVIFKKFCVAATGQLLPFPVAFRAPLYHLVKGEILDKYGIGIIDNSADEIRTVVCEMLDHLEGREVYSDEDEERQRKFNALNPMYEPEFLCRVGASFLESHNHLLGS